MPAPIITCIYCGKTAPSSREHIVQDGLGGVDRIPDVCEPCNKLLGEIDKHLSVESPLAVYARRELNRAGLSTVWDVDERRRNLLLEARQTPGSDSMTLLPQVILGNRGNLFYADEDDLKAVGGIAVQDVFYPALERAFAHFEKYGPDAKRKHHKADDMLKLAKIRMVRPKYRLPPRVCTYNNVVEYKSPLTFVLRYHTDEDLEFAIKKLRAMTWSARAKKVLSQRGSKLPELHCSYCPEVISRAISKVGLNILARYCAATKPTFDTFRAAIDWITFGRWQNLYGHHKQYGFVKPAGLAPMACPSASHKFRLTYNRDIERWMVYASLFGGKAAAFATFAGPNHESWNTIEVVAPLKREMLAPTFDDRHLPLDVEVTMDMGEILPNEPWRNGEIHIRRERARSWRNAT